MLLSNSGATLGVPKICSFDTTFNDGIAAFLYLSDEYYGDYYREYASMKKFIDNECEIQYSIFDDTGSYTGHFIKCKKITESNKEWKAV